MRLSPPTAPSFGAQPHFGVPGGMCGVPYDQHIQLPPGWRVEAVVLDERCGVRALAQQPEHLIGTPVLDGTYVLRMECIDARGAHVTAEARLVISRDPRSLWRNLPSDRGSPYWKPDHASERVALQGWRAQAISRRGRAHAQVGKCREDDVALCVLGDQAIAAVVADGAGSAGLSRLGSQCAVTAAIRALAAAPLASLDSDALHARIAQAARAADAALQSTAEQHAIALGELATTLLLCVLVPGSETRLACLQIGDGVIAMADRSGIRPLCAADRGEYASQTRFLCSARLAPPELATRIHVQALPGLRWVLMATDGVSDPYLETEQSLHDAQCWAPIAAPVELAIGSAAELAEQQLTQWLETFTPGHHDDRTLVLLHAAGASSEVLP